MFSNKHFPFVVARLRQNAHSMKMLLIGTFSFAAADGTSFLIVARLSVAAGDCATSYWLPVISHLLKALSH
jgi:hypothetical protein